MRGMEATALNIYILGLFIYVAPYIITLFSFSIKIGNETVTFRYTSYSPESKYSMRSCNSGHRGGVGVVF